MSTTTTSTLPRTVEAERAHEHANDAETTQHVLPTIFEDRPVTRPRPTQRGAGGLLRRFLSDDHRASATDSLMLLGPNGGPLWATRVR